MGGWCDPKWKGVQDAINDTIKSFRVTEYELNKWPSEEIKGQFEYHLWWIDPNVGASFCRIYPFKHKSKILWTVHDPIDEGMGPGAIDCPLKYIKILRNPCNEIAREWRRAVILHARVNNATKQKLINTKVNVILDTTYSYHVVDNINDLQNPEWHTIEDAIADYEHIILPTKGEIIAIESKQSVLAAVIKDDIKRKTCWLITFKKSTIDKRIIAIPHQEDEMDFYNTLSFDFPYWLIQQADAPHSREASQWRENALMQFWYMYDNDNTISDANTWNLRQEFMDILREKVHNLNNIYIKYPHLLEKDTECELNESQANLKRD